MTTIIRRATALLLMCTAASAWAQAPDSGIALAQRLNCMSCHSISRNFMGPSFQNVAAKYAGVAGARDMLARKIVEGGVGVWGMVPMPANAQLTADQADTLADWILTLR
jgi:cytochrome c